MGQIRQQGKEHPPGALGDPPRCLMLLLKHTSAAARAHIHSLQPAEHLLEKQGSKHEIHKRLMPRKSLGALQSSRDLMGLA